MTCTWCESSFEADQTLVASVNTDDGIYLWLTNQGTNICQITRIELCYVDGEGNGGTMYLRPPPEPIAWMYPMNTLEPGLEANFYQLVEPGADPADNGFPPGTTFQALVEYVEVFGRARSCATTI
jgi:hypothetical protein